MPKPSPLALHVTLRWRDDVIAIDRLTGTADAKVGEGAGSMAQIPCARVDLARVARGAAWAVAPEGSAVTIRRAGGAYEIVEGPADVPLAAGDAALLDVGDFHVEASAEVPEILPRGRRRGGGAMFAIAMAALAHATALGLAMHDAMARGEDAREDERAEDLRGLIASAEQRARAADPPIQDGIGAGEAKKANERAGDGRNGGGAKAAGDEGKMGDHLARAGAHRRYAVPADQKADPAPQVTRAEALADAANFGMIGLLAQGPETPAAAFGDATSHGLDALAARGDLWARQIGESYGAGGLGLSGIGEGGGGLGEGIGLGMIGTLGHATGKVGPGTGGDGSLGSTQGGSWSSHHGPRRTHRVSTVWRRTGYTCTVGGCMFSGRLPPDAVQRIIRQNHGRFRACYEQGLVRNPALQGRVVTRFVIDRSGAVASATDGGSDLPDKAVIGCVVRAFYGISFPQPEGGIVTVTYPLAFQQTI